MRKVKVRQSFPFDTTIKAFIQLMSYVPQGRGQCQKLHFGAAAFMYTSAALASRNHNAFKK